MSRPAATPSPSRAPYPSVPAGAVAAVIPARDEEASLPGVLEALAAQPVGRVVVVDNGSRDATARVAEKGGATVVSEPARGYGSACLAGLRHLSAGPAPPEVVVFLDADHSDDPTALPRLVGPILRGDADLVLGVRRAPGAGSAPVPLHARLGNGLVLGLARLLFGHRFRDLPPFRAISFARLRELEMDDRTWGWTLQMQLRALRHGLRIREVEVLHRPRRAGRSKISGSLAGSLRAGARMLYTLARERLRGR